MELIEARSPMKPHLSSTLQGKLIFLWGVGGVLFLLTNAVRRLAPIAWQPIQDGTLSWALLGAYAAWVIFMGYSEGYRGFQKAFCPRVVARGVYVSHTRSPLHILLAPALCMGLFHATRKRKIVSWSLLIGIVGLVLLVRQLPQPYRGIIDGGVVVGLGWGVLWLLIFASMAVLGKHSTHDPEVPNTREDL